MYGIGSGYAGLAQQPQPPQMTADQRDQLTNMLADHDGQNLSDSDARRLVDQIKELGITPSRELNMVLAEHGFDARSIAAQAGLAVPNAQAKPHSSGYQVGPNGVTGPQSIEGARSTVDEKVLSLISEVMDSLNEAEDNSATFATRLAQRLEQEGYDSTAPIMDFYA